MASESGSWPLPDERAPFATASRSRRGRKQPRPCGCSRASPSSAEVSSAPPRSRSAGATRRSATPPPRPRWPPRTSERSGSSRGLPHCALRWAEPAAQRPVTAPRPRQPQHPNRPSCGRRGRSPRKPRLRAATASPSPPEPAAATASARIASELKTLDTYLATTPAAQLDPGYVASQTAYLARQLTRLQGEAGTVGTSVTSLESPCADSDVTQTGQRTADAPPVLSFSGTLLEL